MPSPNCELISFGSDITEPAELENCTAGDILASIRDGQWREPVLRVRSLPPDSSEQRDAKKKLPYVTWSGVFSHRANHRLEHHSGLIGVDIDALSSLDCTKTIQDAVADPHCLAAYRSVRNNGVRIIIRVPPCSAAEHEFAFDQVAVHVRNVYGHEPDACAKDVSRASFVSFDDGLWWHPNARVLPIIPGLAHSDSLPLPFLHRCVPREDRLGRRYALPWGSMGRFHVGTSQKPDGTVYTHVKLLNLGKAMALHAHRLGYALKKRDYQAAAKAWLNEHERKGLRLRGLLSEYLAELSRAAEDARRKPWFEASVDKWTRWTRLPDFPSSPEERLKFCIDRHCQEAGTPDFFIGARDAAMVSDVSPSTGCRLLRKLVMEGTLQLLTLPGQRLPYHAYDYRLIEINPAPLAPIIRVLSGPQATQSATGGGSSAPETWAQGEDTATPALNLPNLDLPREITISQTLEALRQ